MKERVRSAIIMIAITLACMPLAPTRVLFFAVAGGLCAYEYSKNVEKLEARCTLWVMMVYLAVQAVLSYLHVGLFAYAVCFVFCLYLALFSGVRNAYTSLQLLTSQNEQLKKTRNAFSAEHCGDLIVEVAPGWRILNEDTQENELSRASYTPFPIIIYGGDIKAERISLPVTTDRIAPTIARAIRIRAPNACSAEPLF